MCRDNSFVICCITSQFLFQGVFVSDEELKKTFLEPENLEDQIEEVLYADAGGEKNTNKQSH